MYCVFDEKDETLRQEAQTARTLTDQEYRYPRVGDVLVWPDGKKARVAHCYSDALQPSQCMGSFFVFFSGGMQFSGGLTGSIPYDKFTLDGHESAPVWFFHHGQTGAHRGVHCELVVRRWQVKE